MRDMIVMAAAMSLSAAVSAGPTKAPAKVPAASGPVAVSRTAYSAKMEAEFRQLDTDKNGALTKKEVEDFELGVIRTQLDAKRKTLFAALDADHNGMISPQEFERLQLPVPKVDASPLMNHADANHDGQVTLQEYRASKLVNFDKLDKDKNGIVTPAEMKAGGLIK